MKQDTQCLMENKVDGYVKGVLLKKLPAEIWDEEVTVEIRKAPESDVMNIIFYGEKYALIVKGAYRGKNNAEFNYRFFTK